MANPQKKMQKIEPLVRIRQMQLDQETAFLNAIQVKKEGAARELQHFQDAYIQGIDRLNRERQSPERKMLEALERSVDYAKSQWYHKLKALRSIENEERLQQQQVFEAHKRLRMLEKLGERYDEQHASQMKIHEQKQLDEFAIQIARRKTAE